MKYEKGMYIISDYSTDFIFGEIIDVICDENGEAKELVVNNIDFDQLPKVHETTEERINLNDYELSIINKDRVESFMSTLQEICYLMAAQSETGTYPSFSLYSEGWGETLRIDFTLERKKV